MLRLRLTTSDFNELWRKADTLKKEVQIDKTVFKNLLMDHSSLIGEIEKANIQYIEPDKKTKRLKVKCGTGKKLKKRLKI